MTPLIYIEKLNPAIMAQNYNNVYFLNLITHSIHSKPIFTSNIRGNQG